MRHHFTVDVEEFFQVTALEPYVTRESWNARESRLRFGLEAVLDLLDESKARATFFTLGWIAERHREAIRSLVDRGHEVASHGTDHRRVTDLDEDSFRRSVRESKATLEDTTGMQVIGFRAPSFSIVPGREWALDILIEEGYHYDSSLFPIARSDTYGYADSPRDPYVIERESGSILELPPSTLKVLGRTLPAAGGAYLRLLPLTLIRRALRSAERRRQPGMFYIHPWELDPGQPRLDVSFPTRIRHYGGLSSTARRVRSILAEFSFCPVAANFDDLIAAR